MLLTLASGHPSPPHHPCFSHLGRVSETPKLLLARYVVSFLYA